MPPHVWLGDLRAAATAFEVIAGKRATNRTTYDAEGRVTGG